MTPTVFSSELLELLERYRRRHIHLVKPSSESWQIELDAETYSSDNQKQIEGTAELLCPPQGELP